MPFWNQIITYINDTLKDGSLNKEVLRPQQFYGLASTIVRRKDQSKATEQLPGIIEAVGNDTPITPDSRQAIQIYHRLERSAYTEEKKSYGNDIITVDTSELFLVVLTNSKLTGITKEVLEPVVRFGIPRNLSPELLQELQLLTCKIVPTGTNFKHVEVFRQEYPQSDYFLTEQVSIMLIRYTVTMTFLSRCIDLDNLI